jgi:hypothetical protein
MQFFANLDELQLAYIYQYFSYISKIYKVFFGGDHGCRQLHMIATFINILSAAQIYGRASGIELG